MWGINCFIIVVYSCFPFSLSQVKPLLAEDKAPSIEVIEVEDSEKFLENLELDEKNVIDSQEKYAKKETKQSGQFLPPIV